MKPSGQRQKTASSTLKNKVTACTKSGRSNAKASGQKRKPTVSEKNNFDSTEVAQSFTQSIPQLPPQLRDLRTSSRNMPRETSKLPNGQTLKPFAKLRLQLFPIDDVTRKGLQKDEHNPHLELTIGAKKKISSVVNHLGTKWGNSRVANGELMLFPYEARLDNLAGYRGWTVKDTNTVAADVFTAVASPAIFRLRYGWFSNITNEASKIHSGEDQDKMFIGDEQTLPMETTQQNGSKTVGDSFKLFPCESLPLNQTTDEAANLKTDNSVTLSWVDGLTNISFGDLLAKISPTALDSNQHSRLPVDSSLSFQQTPFSCDSFDAAIASHIARSQVLGQSSQVPNSSIWDAEETCHAFPFQKTGSAKEFLAPPGNADMACIQNPFSPSFPDMAKENDQVRKTKCHTSQEATTDLQHQKQEVTYQGNTSDLQPQPQVQISSESNLGLADIRWDSLGPLEFGMPSKRIGSDSISFSGLLANSRDAFQSCSLDMRTS